MSRRAAALGVAAFATAILSATSLAAAPARPRPGHYAGATSEQWPVKFQVTHHGKRITGFSTVDAYNDMCHFTGAPPHFFHHTVRVASMRIKRGGSFTATVKATVVADQNLWSYFRVRGRISSGRAHGTVTQLRGRAASAPTTCGAGASNPSTSPYLETFSAKRT